VPIEKPQATAAAPTRRSFLTRTAAGGALVTVAGPLTGLFSGAAGATPSQVDAAEELSDDAFARFATPLELGAVQVYNRAASRTDQLDGEWTELVRRFQAHHQETAATLATLIVSGSGEPAADADIIDTFGTAVDEAGDQEGLLGVLADLEGVLTATHLWAIGGLEERLTARLVLQVSAAEAQQATVLALGAGTDVAEVTPDVATTEDARTGSPRDLALSAILGRDATADDDAGTDPAGDDPAATDDESGN
jgi:hypothetical protein